MSYSDEYLIVRLQDAYEFLGHSPSEREIDANREFPSRNAYRAHFGSLEAAKTIAGIPPSLRGMDNENAYRARFGGRDRSIAPARVSMRLRFSILERDNFTCVYCGRTPSDGAKLQVDHVLPISLGGRATAGNLVTSCLECNLGKSGRPLAKRIPHREGP